MTNLQQNAPRVSGTFLRRLWFWGPLGTGALVAAILAGALVVPQWFAYLRDLERLRQLEALRDEVSLMRGQLKTMDQNEEKGEQQKARLIEVIAGRGDASTMLAMLDREARAAGVRLDLFEPQAAPPPPPPPAPGAPPAAAPAAPPPRAPPAADGGIEIEGLQRRTVLMTARGSYPALLTFLRRVEELSLLVAQQDLSLTLDEPRVADPKAPPKLPQVVLKLAFSFYVKPAGAPAGAPAPAPAPPPRS